MKERTSLTGRPARGYSVSPPCHPTYIDAWCVTFCLRREEILEVKTMIPEVLALGLLVYKTPYSGCIEAGYDDMSKL